MMEQLPEDDPERQVETLRQFQRAAIFRIAVARSHRPPAGDEGERPAHRSGGAHRRARDGAGLAADDRAVRRADVRRRRGRAARRCASAPSGYGKLGGMELGYSSDLDLVFLHDSHGERQETDAARPIDNQVFFVRLAQRIVHLLTMHSRAGRLYEVDVRLRPSGKGGMLDHEHPRVRGVSAEGGVDLGAPGAAACARRWPARRSCARRSRRVRAGRAPQSRAPRHAPRRRCASMRERMRKELSQGEARPVRHQAGCRRHRRHRVPRPVLGAALGEGLPAGRDVLGHHPAARVGGLRGARAAGDGGRADECLPRVSHPLAPPVARDRAPIVADTEFVASAPRSRASGMRRWRASSTSG